MSGGVIAEPFRCNFCPASFETYFQLIEHYDNEHNGMRPENR
jgi:hypothetical protein